MRRSKYPVQKRCRHNPAAALETEPVRIPCVGSSRLLLLCPPPGPPSASSVVSGRIAAALRLRPADSPCDCRSRCGTTAPSLSVASPSLPSSPFSFVYCLSLQSLLFHLFCPYLSLKETCYDLCSKVGTVFSKCQSHKIILF